MIIAVSMTLNNFFKESNLMFWMVHETFNTVGDKQVQHFGDEMLIFGDDT